MQKGGVTPRAVHSVETGAFETRREGSASGEVRGAQGRDPNTGQELGDGRKSPSG